MAGAGRAGILAGAVGALDLVSTCRPRDGRPSLSGMQPRLWKSFKPGPTLVKFAFLRRHSRCPVSEGVGPGGAERSTLEGLSRVQGEVRGLGQG